MTPLTRKRRESSGLLTVQQVIYAADKDYFSMTPRPESNL